VKECIEGGPLAFVLALVLSASAGVQPPIEKKLDLDCGNGVAMKLVLIPAGEFVMGGEESPEQVARKCGSIHSKARWFKGEQPRHRVKITKAFYMGIYDVTQAQYEAVMGTNPAQFKDPNNPVETVSWNDAQEFCRKLSAKTGQEVRLPTEAEWEYACRAGTTTPFNTGEAISTEQANYNGNFTYGSGQKGVYREKTTAVGSFPANAWGLYDMHGNVWQWCQDWYGDYGAGEAVDPTGPALGQWRVLRGGSWAIGPCFCRSALRFGGVPVYRSRNAFGFRIVCAPRP
jgi:formylglycine-generating enzyme required for sulfatase activity